MRRFVSVVLFSAVVACSVRLLAQAPISQPAAPARPQRPSAPTRDPHTPGYVTAKELPDGANAPINEDGNFNLGPTHNPAPEMAVRNDVPRGAVCEFTMNSTDSKLYPGMMREPGTHGTADPNNPLA